MNKVFGIDISVWQKGINLTTAKNEGVQFAIIRGGYTGSKNKALAKDSQFESHYKNAKANGLGVGVYWFSRACSYQEGVNEANYLYNKCLIGKQFEYPIYIDVEDTVYQSKAGKVAVTNAIKGFCETLEAKGYYVGVYCNTNWIKNYINYNELKDKYDFWIALWNKTKPSNTYKYGMWQFGGETNKVRTNKVAGVTCDQNYAYKDYPTIMKNVGLNGFSKENNVSIPTPQPKTVEELAQEVIDGKHGNGQARIDSLGNRYDEVQERVNEILNTKKTVTYTVKNGDTLYNIAKKYNTTVDKLVKDNNIKNSALIYPNQKIIIK